MCHYLHNIDIFLKIMDAKANFEEKSKENT
ncbi:MAG: hypothetical protein K0S91_1262 [Nitrososphaeraceae archaeon]|jgi:hypothetical protein|nr:hypothetical protein [Nitrososphaeraceae archaeon]